jgi:hypothetical protein
MSTPRPLALAAMVALLALAGCSGFTPEPVAALRGRIELSVEPNPIVAIPLGGDRYELKFDIVMREAGGVGVRIEDFTVDAIAYRTITVRSQTYPPSFITDRGYPASIAAGKYLRFSFTKTWELPTHLLLSGASASVTARIVDENGVHGQSVVRVGVVVPDRRGAEQ